MLLSQGELTGGFPKKWKNVVCDDGVFNFIILNCDWSLVWLLGKIHLGLMVFIKYLTLTGNYQEEYFGIKICFHL